MRAVTSVAVVFAGCGHSGLPSSPPVVDVTMSDYRFAYRRPVPAGRVVVIARNGGHVDHELVLVVLPKKFPGGINGQLHSSQRKAFPTRAFLPRRPPGAQGSFAVDLKPGRYGFVCFVRDADGQTHALKGMASEVRVQ